MVRSTYHPDISRLSACHRMFKFLEVVDLGQSNLYCPRGLIGLSYYFAITTSLSLLRKNYLRLGSLSFPQNKVGNPKRKLCLIDIYGAVVR